MSGLDDELNRACALADARRYAEALTLLAARLDRDPGDARTKEFAALWLWAATQRSYRPELPTRLLNEPAFDPFFADCTAPGCGRTWVPSAVAAAAPLAWIFGGLLGMGARCARCGVVRCGHHVPLVAFLPPPFGTCRTPGCGGRLEPLTIATGRRPRSFRLPGGTLRAVLVLREGPVPPEPAYVDALLRTWLPALYDRPWPFTLYAVACPGWPEGKYAMHFRGPPAWVERADRADTVTHAFTGFDVPSNIRWAILVASARKKDLSG